MRFRILFHMCMTNIYIYIYMYTYIYIYTPYIYIYMYVCICTRMCLWGWARFIGPSKRPKRSKRLGLRLRAAGAPLHRQQVPGPGARRARQVFPGAPGLSASLVGEFFFFFFVKWLWWSKPMGSHFGIPFWGITTHFRTCFSGDWDVRWGITGVLAHGQVDCRKKSGTLILTSNYWRT